MPVASDHRRRALGALAASRKGRQEWFLRAHGISSELLADLIEAGLATMQLEPMNTGGREVEVQRIRITDAGRKRLAERR
jgi:hypothetical protein